MKKSFLGLAFFLVCSNYLAAQENTSKKIGGLYIRVNVVHSYKFNLNNTLTDMGCKKIRNLFTGGVIGIYFDIKKVELTLEAGFEGIYAKTRLLNGVANLSAGYKLTLPKKQSLVFAGNISYNGYNVYAYADKANFDFQNPDLTNSNMFNLKLDQFMLGPKITWRNNFYRISIGYDFGFIPTHWKSENLNISNSPKERIDRVYFGLGFNLARY